MSKKIYIIRHAKAEKGGKGLDDFSRKITPKGKKQCKELGAYIKKNKIKPDLILCSPAKRCRQTLDGIQKSFEKADIVYDEKIYEANPKNLLRMLQYIDDKYENVILIGHNPSILTLSAALSNTLESNIKDLKRMLNRFPTSAMACFTSDIDAWRDVAVDSLKLASFVRTK